MKLEKTCRCIETTPKIKNDHKPEETCEFIKGREYQVDIFTCLLKPEWYKVYPNGGVDDWIFINNEDFERWFEEID